MNIFEIKHGGKENPGFAAEKNIAAPIHETLPGST
jgi:hypothetical protein